MKIDDKLTNQPDKVATEVKTYSTTTKKLENVKLSFDAANGNEENQEKLTGAKLLKKLAREPSKPPKMREIDVEKRESVNKELLNMIDDMVSNKPITQYYDINTLLVQPKTGLKVTKPTVRQDEIPTTTRSPTLPKPRIAIVSGQSDRKAKKIITNTINDVKSTDNNNTKMKIDNNKKNKDKSNASKNNKLNGNFDENPNKNNNYNGNEKCDMDALDYSEMDFDLTIDSSEITCNSNEKSNSTQVIKNNDINIICPNSVENTSRSLTNNVTSTSNQICAPQNIPPDSDNSSPKTDNFTPDNDNTMPNNDNFTPNIENLSGNNVVDSTQNNGKRMDSDTFNYHVMVMKMFLAQMSKSFNHIYEFM